MTLRVLGRASSINVRKVLWTCSELELQFEHVEADAKLLSRNPNAMVPVIEDGDFVLWESNAICRYLASKVPRNSLLPEDPQRRARVEQWMDWQISELNPAWSYAFSALVRNRPSNPDPGRIAASVESWNRHMKLLDDHFAVGEPFICGDLFSLADVLLGLSTHRWLLAPIERPHLDFVNQYHQRVSVRPAFRAHVDPRVP